MVVEIVGLPVCVEGLAYQAVGKEYGDAVGGGDGEGQVYRVEPAAFKTVFGHASVEEEHGELGGDGAENKQNLGDPAGLGEVLVAWI